MKKNEIEMRSLQEILDTLMGMESMLPADADRSSEEHAEWMRQFKDIAGLVERARHLALLTTPRDIFRLMEKIETRKDALLSIGRQKEQEQPMETGGGEQ